MGSRDKQGTVLLVGEIAEVPKSTPWYPDRLEAATRRSQSVILAANPSFSVGIMFKVLTRLGKLTKLPKGKSRADYLSAEQEERLRRIESIYDTEYGNRSFMLTARDLLNKRLDFDNDARSDVTNIVRKTAQKVHIPVRPVGRIDGGDMLDSLLAAPPQAHVPCLETAMRAVEAGPEIIRARGLAWTSYDVPAVMASPLERALGSCWPWTDVEFGPELRGQWIREIGLALKQPGVTMAVVPLRFLAEPGGLLDQFEAQGHEIIGPPWRSSPSLPMDHVPALIAR